MKLNCKPGDLAVIVNSPPEVAHNIGKIVEVKRLTTSWDGQPCWMLKRPFPDVVNGRRAVCEGIADSALRPIRDPGDDAVDESHAYLPPVPHKEHA